MITIKCAQRILDYRVFRLNLGQFSVFINEYRAKYERWMEILKIEKNNAIIKDQENHFRSIFKKLYKWFGNYQ